MTSVLLDQGLAIHAVPICSAFLELMHRRHLEPDSEHANAWRLSESAPDKRVVEGRELVATLLHLTVGRRAGALRVYAAEAEQLAELLEAQVAAAQSFARPTLGGLELELLLGAERIAGAIRAIELEPTPALFGGPPPLRGDVRENAERAQAFGHFADGCTAASLVEVLHCAPQRAAALYGEWLAGPGKVGHHG